MNYWTRLRDVITFIIVWLAIPLYLEQCRDVNAGVYVLLLLTWIPALFVVIYLNDS